MGVNEDFDAMLGGIGACGPYQIRQNILVGLAIIFSAFSTLGFIFTAGRVDHRCMIEECEDGPNEPFSPPWLDKAIPFDRDTGKFASCLAFKSNTTCNFNPQVVERCHSWVFRGQEKTIQTEFLITCPENQWKLALVGTSHHLGNLIGMPISGIIADRYGRKFALVASLLSSSVLGIFKALASSYEMFLFLETVEPILGGNIYGISFILALELVTPARRALGCTVVVVAFALGNAVVGGLAWLLQEWRLFLWTANLPALLFICYSWLLPESVRWLIARGRLGDAKKVIQSAARMNKVLLREDGPMADWKNGQADRVYAEGGDKDESLWPSLKRISKSSKLLTRLMISSFIWACVNLIFFGMSLNSVSLAGTDNKYLNFILTGIVEAPSYLITLYCMNRLGRRKTLCLMFVASGAASFISPFVSVDAIIARLAMYLLGKIAITGAFDTSYVFTAEIFPTKLRNSLLGVCAMFGRFGAMLAPQTPDLALLSKFLPLTLFGVASAVAGFLALLLPETNGSALPVTIEEAENLSRWKKIPTDVSEKNEKVHLLKK